MIKQFERLIDQGRGMRKSSEQHIPKNGKRRAMKRHEEAQSIFKPKSKKGTPISISRKLSN